jgi:hypothetical protein
MNFIKLIIQILHILLFLFLSCSIFISEIKIKQIALIILIFLFIQYIINYGKCGLTELEYFIMGEKYKEGFLYRLITPVIKRDENYFNYYYYIFHILWIIILCYQIQ